MVIFKAEQHFWAMPARSLAVRGWAKAMPTRSLEGRHQPSVGWASRT
jgi:hypothetical protein